MLLTDPDYFIHNLRLSYLRNVAPQHDPTSGPSLILETMFNPACPCPSLSSPYVILSDGLDTDKWPELKAASSSPDQPSHSSPQLPEPRPSPSRGASRLGGATGLKYSETIVGDGKSLASNISMRVGGTKRRSWMGRKRPTRTGDNGSDSSSVAAGVSAGVFKPSAPREGKEGPLSFGLEEGNASTSGREDVDTEEEAGTTSERELKEEDTTKPSTTVPNVPGLTASDSDGQDEWTIKGGDSIRGSMDEGSQETAEASGTAPGDGQLATTNRPLAPAVVVHSPAISPPPQHQPEFRVEVDSPGSTVDDTAFHPSDKATLTRPRRGTAGTADSSDPTPSDAAGSDADSELGGGESADLDDMEEDDDEEDEVGFEQSQEALSSHLSSKDLKDPHQTPKPTYRSLVSSDGADSDSPPLPTRPLSSSAATGSIFSPNHRSLSHKQHTSLDLSSDRIVSEALNMADAQDRNSRIFRRHSGLGGVPSTMRKTSLRFASGRPGILEEEEGENALEQDQSPSSPLSKPPESTGRGTLPSPRAPIDLISASAMETDDDMIGDTGTVTEAETTIGDSEDSVVSSSVDVPHSKAPSEPDVSTPAPSVTPSFPRSRERRRVTLKGRLVPDFDFSTSLVPIKERDGSEELEGTTAAAPVPPIPENVDELKPITPLRIRPKNSAPNLSKKSSNDSLHPHPSPSTSIRVSSRERSFSADHRPTEIPEVAVKRKVSAPALMPNAKPLGHDDRPSPHTRPQPPRPAPLTFPSRAVFTIPRKVPPPPTKSGLSLLLSAHSSGSPNPFSPIYSSLGTKAADALHLSLYFPHSEEPTRPIKVGVRRDVSVEEVVGFGLWTYWEEGRKPDLEPADPIENESANWNLMMVEDDGEVDEDFPAFDRLRPISRVDFDEFAIVKATLPQAKDNLAKQATIERRPQAMPSRPAGASLAPPIEPHKNASVSSNIPTATPIIASSMRPSAATLVDELTQTVLLKVKIPKDANKKSHDVEVTTTLAVLPGTYMADVLDMACKKQSLGDSKEWAFTVPDGSRNIVVPLDRTVESLGDTLTLQLVRRNTLPAPVGRVAALQNINPSASIFKRLSEPHQPEYVSATDLTSNYRKFNVHRKTPLPIKNHERVLAIDGNYIHVMPSESKAMFDGGRIASYHVNSVSKVERSKRAPTTFRFTVRREGGEHKRYEFDAETAKEAAEITACLEGAVSRGRK